MKCYICLTDSISTRKDYLDLLQVTLISARKNTSLELVCLYDGEKDDATYKLLKKYHVHVIFHPIPYKQELMEIYPKEWMIKELGKEIDYNRIFGTFMRMEIPMVEKEEEYVLYTDMDVIFNDDIRLEDLPRPKYLAAAPEFDQDIQRMTAFNAGILLININGVKEKYQDFRTMMLKKQRNSINLFDQGYLNELCFKDMELLPNEYNWKPYWGINEKAKIIHFHGMKPGCKLEEAGFTTDTSFYKTVFENNPNGYAGYIYYFVQFYRYLGDENNKWLYLHLQSLFNLYRTPDFVHPLCESLINTQKEAYYRKRYEKYRCKYKLFKRLLWMSSGLLLITVLYTILTSY